MRKLYKFFVFVFLSSSFAEAFAQPTSQTFNASGNFTVPAGVVNIKVECWGGGGGGGFGRSVNLAAGGGGGGGAYSITPSIAVIPANVIAYTVGAGGTGGTAGGTAATAGGTTTFSTATPVVANGGGFGAGMSVAGNGAGGAGGAAGTFAGGAGAVGQGASGGGGGGGSAGTAIGGNTATTQTGAVAVTGGGDGGSGANNTAGTNGTTPGGGGGGGQRNGNSRAGGNGGVGQITVTYTIPSITSFLPTCASGSGVSVVITGTNFTGATAVTFNGTAATYTVNSATQITAVVPVGATTGTINVTEPGGNTGTSASNFSITPASITTGPVSTPICKGATVNVPFTVTCGPFNGGNTFTAQLSNAAGSFAAPTVIGTLVGTGSGAIAATIPVGTATGTGYLIRVISSNPVTTGTNNSNGNITISTPMTYSSSAVAQIAGNITKNCAVTSAILEIQVVVTGSCTPLSITQFNLNTTGSTNTQTDISDAKVFYTGQTQGFNSFNQFGSTVSNPNGAFTVNGSQELSFGAGTYYFYVAYDVPSTATTGDVVDASVTSFVLSGSTIASMTTPNPAGNRSIVAGNSCAYSIVNFPDMDFCTSSYPTAYQTIADDFYLNESTTGNDFDVQAAKILVLTLPTGFQFNPGVGAVARGAAPRDISSAPTLTVTATSISVTITTNNNINQDHLTFSGFQIRATAIGSGDLVRSGGTFTVEGSTAIPTTSESFGHMVAGAPMVYSSSSVAQYTNATINNNCTTTTNPMLEIQVNVTNPCPPVSVTQFNFTTAGSTNAADITEAEIYYTGQTQGFSNSSWFGLASAPNGAFTINGSQQLDLGAGTYYFYLVYDVPSSAVVTDVVDATMNSFVINGVTESDMSPNPVGSRTIATGTCAPTPDVPNPPHSYQTITQGSYVIPMDNAHQNLFGGLPFNLKAYGLVNELLQNDIPLKWVILSGKAKDAPDFTANASLASPSVAATATQTFVASEFIIDSFYVDNSFYAGGKTAAQVITAFNTAPPSNANVAVYKLTADVANVDVRYTLNSRPKIAIFNNGTNAAIQKAMLDTARFRNYTVESAGEFTGLADCFTFCSEAHWAYTAGDPVLGNTSPVQNVVDFVNQGGNFLAQCAGIDLYENHQPGGGHFQTTNGITYAGPATNTYTTTSNPDMAFDQYDGALGGFTLSTIANFWPAASSVYKPEMYYGVSAPLATSTVVASGAHLADPDSIGSNVFYLGGHSYAATSSGSINGSRMYLNAALVPAHRPHAFQLNPGTNATLCIGQSTTLGCFSCSNPSTPPAIYVWSPSTGLNNTTSANPVATPTVTTVYTVIANNNGCLGGPNSVTVTVNPLPTITTAATAASGCLSAAAQNTTLTYGAVTGAPTNYTITWNAAALAAGLVNVGSTALPVSPITVPIAAGVAAGTYSGTLTVTNGNGCASTGNAFTVTINPLPTIAPAATAAAVCVSAAAQNTTLTYGATTGTPTNYTITWNAAALAAGLVNVGSTALPVSPITVPIAAGVAAGTYSGTLTVTNGNGCASTGNAFTVTINPLPTIAPAATAAAVCVSAAAQNTTLTYGATTGTPTNYTITWNAAALAAGLVNVGSTALPVSPITVPIAAGVAAGTYSGTLTVTNGNGCASTGNAFTVTINPLPTIAPAATAAAVCVSAAAQNTTLTYGAVTGAPTNYTITWNAAALAAGLVNVGSTALPVSPITVPIAAGVAAGTYSGTLTVTNGNGCASTGNAFTVTINPLPTIAPAATAAAVCVSAAAQNTTLTYGATTGTPTNYTITWNAAALAAGLVNVGSTALPVSPITVPIAAGVAAGTYSGTLTVTNGNGCASTGNAFTVTINPLPTIAPAATAAAVCVSAAAQNTTLTYGATTGTPTNYTITWNAAALAAGLVNVGSTALPVSPITVPIAAGVAAGTYSGTLTVTNGNGCASTGNAFTVTINPLPTIAPAATAAAVCVSAAAQNTTLTYGATTGTPTNYTITWNAAALAAGLVNVGSTALPVSPITVPIAAGVAAGTYSGTLTVTNGNGCASTGNAFTVTINPLPTIAPAATAAAVCVSAAAQNTTLTYGAVTGAPTNYTITWNAAALAAGLVNVGSTALPVSPITVPIAAGVAAGTYSGTLTVTNGNGCASTGNAFTVTINPLPTIAPAATAAAVCVSAAAQNTTLTYGATTGTPTNYTITWNAAALAAGLVNVGSTALPVSPITVPIAAGVAAGTYSGTLTVTNGNGCASTGNAFTVTINPLPTIAPAATAAAVCVSAAAQNTTLTYGATTGTPTNYTITWNAAALAAGLVNVGSTALPVSPITVPIAAGVAAGTYSGTLTVTNGNGCASTGNAFTVTINPLPTIAPAATAAAVCVSAAAQNSSLTYGATTGTPTNYTITWNAAALAAGLVNVGSTALPVSPITVPIAAGVAAGTYSGTLTVTNGNGCASTGNAFTVTINPLPTIAPAATAAAVCVSAAAQNTTLTYGAVTGAPTNYTITWNAAALAAGLVNVGSTALPVSPITVPIAAGVAAGTYSGTLTVTNGNGCASTGNAFTVTINPLPTIAPAATAAAVCVSAAAQNTTLTYGATTGTPTNYTITWNAAALAAGLVNVGSTALPVSPITVPIAAGVAAGTYTGTLTVTNGNGCASTGNAFTVTINPLPTIAPAATAAAVCVSAAAQNTTLTYGAVTGAPTNYTITWNAAALAAGLVNVGSTALPVSPITVPIAAGVAAGTYSGTLTVTNGNGCASTGNVFTLTITPTDNPSFNYSAGTYCPSGSTTPTITGGFTGTFSETPVGLVIANASTGQLNLGASSAGTYTVTFTTNGPCPAQSSEVITITNAGVADFHYNTPFCKTAANPSPVFDNGGSAGVFTSSPAGLSFVSASTGQIDLNASAVGNYTITNTLTAAGCFTVTATNTVTIDPAATVNAGADQTICAGSPVTLAGGFGGAASSASWSGGAGGFSPNSSTLNAVYTPSAAEVTAGTVTLTLTTDDPAGSCGSVSDNMIININPLPTISPAAAAADVCFSALAQNSSLTYGATTNAPTNYTINWNAAALAAGLVNVGSTALPVSPITVPIAAGVVPATYTGTLTVTNGNGCASTGNAFTLTINPLPTIAPAATAADVCFNASAQNSSLTYGATTNAPTNYTITWNAAALAAGLINVGSTAIPVSPITVPIAAGVAAGTYSGTLTVTNGNGCASTGNAFTVTINPLPTIAHAAAAADVCFSASAQNSSLTYGATTNAPTNYTITWNAVALAAGLVNVGSTALPVSPITVPIAAGVAAGTYSGTLTVTNGNGCASTGSVFTVTINPLPTIAPAATAADVCFSASAQNSSLTYGATTNSPTNYTITWNAAALAAGLVNVGSTALPVSPITVPIAAGVAAGTYTATLTVTNGNGCASSTGNAFTITINPLPVVTSANSATICSGDILTIPLTADIASTFTWIAADNPNTTGESTTLQSTSTISNTIVNNTLVVQTVIYTVTATTITTGCTGTPQTVTVTVNPTPSLSASSNSPVCLGGSINLTATTTGGSTFSWSGPLGYSSASQNPSISPATTSESGTYSVTTTSAAGCVGTTSTTNVIVNPPPPAPASGSNSPVCSGQTLSLSVASIVSASYSWSGPSGFSSALQNPTINNVTTAATGTYSIIATVPGCGASSTGTVSVTINQTPAAPTASSNSPICEGNDLSLTASTVGGSTYTWSGPNGYSDPSQNPVITAATTVNAGTYSVTATENGCTGLAGTTSVIINTSPAAPIAVSNSPLCVGNTLSLTASTIATATYSWIGPNGFSSPLQNPTRAGITLADAGTYSVSATVNGCTGLAGTTSVVVNPIPAAPVAGSNSPICSGNDLSLTASTVGGSTYNWIGPSGFSSAIQDPTIAAATVAASGTYSVTATENGCTSPAGITAVTVNQTPTPPVGNNGPLCIGDNLSLTAGNIAGATYAWSGPNGFSSAAQNPVIVNAQTSDAGTYSVIATANGCIGPAGTTSVIVSPPPTAPSAGSNSPVCTGQTLSLTATTFAGGSYTWNGPNGFSSPTQNPALAGVTIAADGNYSVVVKIGSCTSPAGTVSVTINQTPAAPVASSNAPICSGSDLSLTASTVGGSTYAWTGPNGFSDPSQNPIITAATTTNAGTYSVTATENGCTGLAGTISVTINPIPGAPSAGNNGPLCIGDNLTLTANTIAGATYSWDGPNGFSSASQNPIINNVATSDAGTYSVSVSVAGCPGTAGTTTVIIAPPPPAPTASSNSPVCSGSDLSLTANTIVGATYNWSGPNGFSSSTQNPTIAAITTAGDGIYSVFVQIGSCTGPAGTTAVTVNQTPAAPTASSNSPVCLGNDLSLTASTVGGSTYAWSGPNGFSDPTQNPVIVGVTTAEAGTYSVIATENGCVGPAGTTTVIISTPPAAPTAGSNSPVCSGQTLSLTASTIASASYNWSGPNIFSSGTQNPTIGNVSTAADGTYSVTATVAGCPVSPAGTVSVTINQTPAAPVASSNAPLCSGSDLSLTASTVGGSTYAWTGPNGFSDPSQNPVIVAATTANTGTYSVTATENGCTGVAGTVSVTVNPIPAAPVAGNNGPLCVGDNLTLTATTIAGATYSWDGPNSFSSASQNPVINNVSTSDGGTYSVSVSLGGCQGAVGTTTVIVAPPPAAPTAGSNSPICSGNDLSLTANTIIGATYNWSGPNSFSSSTQDPVIAGVTIAADGSYSVFVQIGSCTSPAGTVSVTVNQSPAAPIAGSNSPLCIGDNLSLTASNVAGTTYAWTGPNGFSDPSQNPIVNNVTTSDAGTYSVIATDIINGCGSAAATVSVVITSPASVNAGSDQTICANNATPLNGIITGGSGTGIWSTPNGVGIFAPNTTALNATYTPNINDTLAGDILLILTSTNNGGCSAAKDTVIIHVTPGPVVNAGVDQSICANNYSSVAVNGSVQMATGGIWSTMGTGTFQSPNTILTNTYVPSSADSANGSVILILSSTGNGSCSAVNDSMRIIFTPAPIVNAGADISVCVGNVTAQLNGTVSGGASTGIWSSSGTGTFSPDNLTLNAIYTLSSADTAAGGVTLVLTSTNFGNCVAVTDTVRITMTAAPIVAAGSDITVCANNDTVALNGTISGGGSTGYWSTSGTGTFTPDSSALNANYIPSAADTTAGSVTLTLASTNGCRVVLDSLMITISNAPVVNAGADVSVCEGVTVALNGSVSSAASGGQWVSTGNGTFAPDNLTLNANYIPGSNDTSSVTLVLTSTGNGQCLAATDTMKITFGRKPVAAFTNAQICTGQSVLFSDASTVSGAGNSIVSWNWTIGGGNFVTQNPSNTYASAGTDSVTLIVTTNIGCSDTVYHIVNIHATPAANYSVTSVCDSASFTDLSGIPTGNIISWSWNFGDGNNSASQNPVHTYSASGSYIVALTVTSDSGCSNTFSNTIIITPCCTAPTASFVVAGSCLSSPVIFTDSSSVAAGDTIATWDWTFGDGGTDTLQNTIHTYTASGTYTVQLVVATAHGCSDTVSETVIINPSPVPSFTVFTSCSLDSVKFTNTSTVSGGNIISWNWNFGDGQNSSLQNPVHHYDSTGTYIVSLTVTSNLGCSATIIDTVNYSKGITSGFTYAGDCQFLYIFQDTSFVAPGDSVVSCFWDFGDGGPTSNVCNPTHVYPSAGTYTVTHTITTAGGCSGTNTVVLTIAPPAIADYSPAGGTYNIGVGINFTDLSSNAVSWNWNFGDGVKDTIENPSHTYTETATLDVVLIVMNTAGCPDTAKYSFILNTNTVAIPTAFTPNGDGVNDVLYVRGGPMKEMDWRVYNEWGNELFHATTQDQGWDGTFKGKPQEASRYIYTLVGTTFKGDKVDMKGNVTIIK